jgi:hypothetical protein
MKLYQLLEDVSQSPISPSNVDAAYNIGSIKIDNAKGLGATPMGQNVQYLGFVACIKPSTFLKLAHAGDRAEDASKLEQLILTGTPIANPFLELKSFDADADSADLNLQVAGHEGRARMHAIQKLYGDNRVPVQFFVRGGMRARHIPKSFFEFFRECYIKSQDGQYVSLKPGDIFWNGQTV